MRNDLPMPRLPEDLPWGQNACLLLDGVSLPDCQRKLREWNLNAEFSPLYRNSPWAQLSDLSPCLIRLEGLSDPILRRFVDCSQAEWGYLLFSPADFDDMRRHLRWLMSVQAPSGESLLLRLADPAVANALLDKGSPRLLGPIEQVCLPDCLQGVWHRHRRAGEPGPRNEDKPYALCENEMDALAEVSFRQSVLKIHDHMQAYFPHYQPALPGRARLTQLQQLAEQAYQQGFCSEREMLLYANVFGFLDDQPLERHPDIASLLHDKSSLTPAQRVEQAATLAEQRAKTIEGKPL